MHGVDFYPAGNFSFLPLALLAYGVFKHRLVEVRSLLHLSFLRAILYAMVFLPNLLLFLWLFPIIAKASEAAQFVFLSLWYLSNTLYVIPIRALAQRWLYKTRNELQQAEVALMKEMLVLGDSGGLISKVNDAVCRLLAFDRIEILTCDASERALILPDGTIFPLPESLYHQLRHRRVIFEATSGNMNVPVTATPASLLGLLAKLDAMYAVVLEHNGNLIGLLALPQKHDQRPLYAEEAAFIKNIAGTGLYNRKAFVEHLESEIRYADRYGSGLGLLFFDLNKFKQVNDTFGHEVGDRLLMGVAKRLLTIVRETDLVARLGGDEFTIILKNPDAVMPEVVARRTAEALARPYEIGGVVIDFVSASIGIAAFPKDGRSAGALMKSADLAMYRAKESNSHWVFCSAPPVQTL